jgi:hypothetical protein
MAAAGGPPKFPRVDPATGLPTARFVDTLHNELLTWWHSRVLVGRLQRGFHETGAPQDHERRAPRAREPHQRVPNAHTVQRMKGHTKSATGASQSSWRGR